MIPKDKIDEIRDRASIVQVISEYIPLTKRGINHIGLCPFHSEKTPSFTVSEDKKIYYCFGCNATGNAITFVMKKEGIAFPEAVRMLAKRYGVNIAEVQKGAPDQRDMMHFALRSAAEFYFRELRGPEGKAAKEYLKKRGFEGEIVTKFGLGYSPGRWDALANYLKRKNISMELAEKCGLVIKREKGSGHYDRFRGRLMFPIIDPRGKVIGFGGRGLDEKAQPKYLNSPESPVFKKGETLYGFPQAKESIMKEGAAIVVEGYFDLLALHKHGFTNSVATMGTALTPEHIKILKSYSGLVYSLFDSDQAGKNAAIRGLDLFLNQEVACRAVLLSKGKDPDEFLSTSGPEAMGEALKKAEPLMEFYLNELEKKSDIKSPEGKRKYFEAARAYLLRVKNVAERGHYASIVASTLGMTPAAVYDALKDTPGAAKGAMITDSRMDARSRLKELTILKVILKHPELFDDKVEDAIGSFADPVLTLVGGIVKTYLKSGRKLDAASLIEEVGDDVLKGSIAGMLFKEDDGFIEAPEKMLEDCLKRGLSRDRLKETTKEQLKKLEEMGKGDIASEVKKRIGSGAQAKKV